MAISKWVFIVGLRKWTNKLMMLGINVLIKGKQEREHINIHTCIFMYIYISIYVLMWKKTHTVDPWTTKV